MRIGIGQGILIAGEKGDISNFDFYFILFSRSNAFVSRSDVQHDMYRRIEMCLQDNLTIPTYPHPLGKQILPVVPHYLQYIPIHICHT